MKRIVWNKKIHSALSRKMPLPKFPMWRPKKIFIALKRMRCQFRKLQLIATFPENHNTVRLIIGLIKSDFRWIDDDVCRMVVGFTIIWSNEKNINWTHARLSLTANLLSKYSCWFLLLFFASSKQKYFPFWFQRIA